MDTADVSPMHPRRWGSTQRAAKLPPEALALVELAFGPADDVIGDPADTTINDNALSPSSLNDQALDGLRACLGVNHVLTDAQSRASHTRGKSTPDLLRARADDLVDAPDAIVRPASHDEVTAIIEWAGQHGVAIVPFGGGTCVTGGLVARREGHSAIVSLDLTRMKRLIEVDHESMTATLEPGLRGPEAEALLAEHGLTLGHFPQSFEYATIGGFAATRSSGQSSAGYGRFDAMVVGLRVATPIGELTLGSAPATAAGPDLRQVILGSEGAFGVITGVRVRVRRLPEELSYEGWSWPDFNSGARAIRTLAQSGHLPTVIRLSDEVETAINLADPEGIGSDNLGGCLMIVGHEGTSQDVARTSSLTTELLSDLGGSALGSTPGQKWSHGRFDAPYLRDSLLDVGVFVETLETATFWSNRQALYDAVTQALREHLPEKHLVLCHISHVYETGCSLYFTVATKFPDDAMTSWHEAKSAVNDAIASAGATITHHHAIGTDHKPWLAKEVGPVGQSILRAIKQELDPDGIMNPGVMIP
ncbi:MAG: FAD-binding oxidoreductase [Nocardioidaceae bacterium]